MKSTRCSHGHLVDSIGRDVVEVRCLSERGGCFPRGNSNFGAQWLVRSPYAWRVPVLVGESDIDDFLDEEDHEKISRMLHDEEMEMVKSWGEFNDD